MCNIIDAPSLMWQCEVGMIRHGQNVYPCILDTGKVWSAWGNLKSPKERQILMIFPIYPNILVLRSITLFIIY